MQTKESARCPSKRVLFKKIKLLLSVFALFVLAACSAGENNSSSDTEAPDTEAPQAVPIFKNEKNRYIIGETSVLVESQKESYAPRYELWNTSTNTVTYLPTMPYFCTFLEAEGEECLVFSATGANSEVASTTFPSIIKCIRVCNDSGEVYYMRIDEQEQFEVGGAIQAGADISANLMAVGNTFDGISFVFGSTGKNDAAFYAGSVSIPITNISSSAESNVMEITFSSCQKDLLFEGGSWSGKNNPYIVEATTLEQEEALTVKLTLTDLADKYVIDLNYQHEPIFLIRFMSD